MSDTASTPAIKIIKVPDIVIRTCLLLAVSSYRACASVVHDRALNYSHGIPLMSLAWCISLEATLYIASLLDGMSAALDCSALVSRGGMRRMSIAERDFPSLLIKQGIDYRIY